MEAMAILQINKIYVMYIEVLGSRVGKKLGRDGSVEVCNFMILFIYHWIWFGNILLRIFLHLFSSKILTCNFLSSVVSLSGFGIRVMLAL